MATNFNEKGHANNAANFNYLISRCIGFGDTYNPSNSKILIPAMQEFSAQVDNVLKNVQVKKIAHDNAVNDRKVIIAKVKPLSTRVMNALKALGLRVETIKNATSINRKIQGQRATPVAKLAKSLGAAVADENQTIPKTISVSQQGIDQVLSNFSQLIELTKAEAAYAPNETELTTQSLEAFYNELRAKNQLFIDTETDLNNARIARNNLMYGADSNIAAIAQNTKNYIKSVFGSNSPQYKSVSAIKIVSYAK